MKLARLSLENFRRFASLRDLNLHPELTVIVARNGQGKSTVLDALSIALSSYTGCFDLGKTHGINGNDARYARSDISPESEQQFPVTIDVAFSTPVIESSKRELTGPNNKTTVKDSAELVKYGKQLMTDVRALKSVAIPVISYYGAGRLWVVHRDSQRKSIISASRTMGYEDCLSSASSFKQLQQWMQKATFAAMQQEQMPDVYSGYTIGQQVSAVSNAVNSMLEGQGWSNFHYSITHDELAMTNEELGTLPVSLLSDGVRAVISLVADLAWRCVKLNPHLAEHAPEKTQGIVLIDEVDMHLHPAWQQRIIDTLRNVFKQVQFVITTHSPQVLSTVPSECIRLLSDGEVYGVAKGSKGAESSRLLKRIFGVDPRPKEDPNTQLLIKYLDLVYDDKWASKEARSLRIQLDNIFGNEEPAITEADLYIENREWEQSFEKDQ